jgi:hypothetical protein
MRAKLMILSAVIVGSVSGVFATGCQTYDFEPVEPLAISQTTVETRIEARNLKPNLMLLVDTSGSMSDPVNPNLAACKNSGGEVCGIDFHCDISKCPTRWSELQGAMSDFLSSSGSVARMGLASYPSDPVCNATTKVRISLPRIEEPDDAAALQAKATEVNASIQEIKNFGYGSPNPEGGTPTAESLMFLINKSKLDGTDNVPQLKDTARKNFVLLLTDGLPNCNAAFSEANCFCTTGDCGGSDKTGCLDQTNSVKAVEALGAQNIQTIVIGFGAAFDASSPSGKKGAETLNAMAEAGGFARIKQCTADAECGAGDTCVAGACGRKFYQAANRVDLAEALRQISERVQTQDPCLIGLNTTELKESLTVVYFTHRGTTTRLAAGQDTWSLVAGEGVRLAGDWCAKITQSTTADPVNVEVRAVRAR